RSSGGRNVQPVLATRPSSAKPTPTQAPPPGGRRLSGEKAPSQKGLSGEKGPSRGSGEKAPSQGSGESASFQGRQSGAAPPPGGRRLSGEKAPSSKSLSGESRSFQGVPSRGTPPPNRRSSSGATPQQQRRPSSSKPTPPPASRQGGARPTPQRQGRGSSRGRNSQVDMTQLYVVKTYFRATVLYCRSVTTVQKPSSKEGMVTPARSAESRGTSAARTPTPMRKCQCPYHCLDTKKKSPSFAVGMLILTFLVIRFIAGNLQ
ncbi:hypothetical protein COOONC_21652, partial [Cooperia oncophora]